MKDLLKAMELLNSPQIKQLIDTVQLFAKILPKFKTETIESEGTTYAALLFEHTEENINRVDALAALLTDIVTVEAHPDFSLDGKAPEFSALLFPLPKENP